MATYPVELAPGASKEGKVCVAVGGGGGFIGSWLALDLKKKGFYVICADWKRNEFMEVPEFCDEFHLADLRIPANCLRVCDGCRDVYNLAADMGGMGFIKSNESVLMYNNTMISFNMLEAARCKGVKRYFYSSSACVYNDDLQLDPENPGLKEGDAWPAKPQDTYDPVHKSKFSRRVSATAGSWPPRHRRDVSTTRGCVVSHRSIKPARPRHRASDSLVDLCTGRVL